MEINKSKLAAGEAQVVRDLEALFASPGWKLLIQRFKPRFDATSNTLEAAEDLRQLGKVQGERAVLRELIELESIIEFELEQHILQKAVEAEAVEQARGAMA